MALRGVGPESEAESVRFHGRRVTKAGPEVEHGLFRIAERARNPKAAAGGLGGAEQGVREAHSGAAGRSGGGERHERFGVVVGEGGVEPRF